MKKAIGLAIAICSTGLLPVEKQTLQQEYNRMGGCMELAVQSLVPLTTAIREVRIQMQRGEVWREYAQAAVEIFAPVLPMLDAYERVSAQVARLTSEMASQGLVDADDQFLPCPGMEN